MSDYVEIRTDPSDQRLHELGFYYAIDLPKTSPFLNLGRDHAGVERGHDLVLRWFPIDALADCRSTLPSFVRRWGNCRTARSTWSG